MHARDLLGRRLPGAALVVVLLTAGCSDGTEVGPDVEQMPSPGVCRVLSPDDVARPSDASDPVDCAEPHTAETYAVGSLPDRFDHAAWDSDDLGAYAYRTCATKFMKFLGADESLVMRTVLNWAWFRPSQESWDAGSRWYRCDVVGGGEQSASYVDLPATTKGLLLGRPDDQWLVCAAGQSVDDATKIPCADQHDWRAVTTIKVGEDEDDYPGDRLVEVRTRDFCSDSVGAWLNYPVTYDFGYTWFHKAEWEAGNRRSVCWAKTES